MGRLYFDEDYSWILLWFPLAEYLSFILFFLRARISVLGVSSFQSKGYKGLISSCRSFLYLTDCGNGGANVRSCVKGLRERERKNLRESCTSAMSAVCFTSSFLCLPQCKFYLFIYCRPFSSAVVRLLVVVSFTVIYLESVFGFSALVD